MNPEIATLDLSFRRKSLILYSLGMALYVFVVVALYPAMKDSTQLDQFTTDSATIAALFGISGSLTSSTGWISANVYANFFPLIILLVTIGYGAWCLAGQEADGHLESVLSLPFSRKTVVGEKIGVLVVLAAVFSAVTFLSTMIGVWFELSFSTANLASTTVGVALLGIDFGLLALAIGALTGERGTALSIAAAIAAASYLISSMAPVVDWLKPFRVVSLFYWSVGDNQLEQGLSWGGLALLVAVGVVLAALAMLAFERHDIS